MKDTSICLTADEFRIIRDMLNREIATIGMALGKSCQQYRDLCNLRTKMEEAQYDD